MAKFCKDCGENVSEAVLREKNTEEGSTGGTDVKFIYEFCYNKFIGETCILIHHVLKETKRSYYIKDIHCKNGRRISKKILDVFVDYSDTILFNTEYPVMYSLDVSENFTQYINMIAEYLQKEINIKQEHLRQVKGAYKRACERDESDRKKKAESSQQNIGV